MSEKKSTFLCHKMVNIDQYTHQIPRAIHKWCHNNFSFFDPHSLEPIMPWKAYQINIFVALSPFEVMSVMYDPQRNLTGCNVNKTYPDILVALLFRRPFFHFQHHCARVALGMKCMIYRIPEYLLCMYYVCVKLWKTKKRRYKNTTKYSSKYFIGYKQFM